MSELWQNHLVEWRTLVYDIFMFVLTDNFEKISRIIKPECRSLALDPLPNPNARTDPVTATEVFNFTTSSSIKIHNIFVKL